MSRDNALTGQFTFIVPDEIQLDWLDRHCTNTIFTVDLGANELACCPRNARTRFLSPDQKTSAAFLPRDALWCKARYWDCNMSSVRPSVTLVDQDHIGWKSWKLISRKISATPSLITNALSNGAIPDPLRPPLSQDWRFTTLPAKP